MGFGEVKHPLSSYLVWSLISIVLPKYKIVIWPVISYWEQRNDSPSLPIRLEPMVIFYDTEVEKSTDKWSVDRFHDHLVHYLLINKLSIIFNENNS
jgi:hypothetical protein